MDKPNEYRTLLAEAERLLSDSTNDAIKDRIELRDAVCDYLEAEQKRGIALPVILESVEGILDRAASRLGEVDGHRQLAKQLIDWCIDLSHRGGQKVT